MVHLVRVHVSGFSNTFSLGSVMVLWLQCADTCKLIGETVPAMHWEVCEGRWEWREPYVALRDTRFPRIERVSAGGDVRSVTWKEGA